MYLKYTNTTLLVRNGRIPVNNIFKLYDRRLSQREKYGTDNHLHAVKPSIKQIWPTLKIVFVLIQWNFKGTKRKERKLRYKP